MATIPTLMQPVDELLDDGTVVERHEDGTVAKRLDDGTIVVRAVLDLAPALAETIARDPRALARITEGRGTGKGVLYISDVSGALSRELWDVAGRGRLGFPGMADRVKALSDAIGGVDGFKRLHAACEKASDADARVERLAREAEKVRAARWEPDPGKFGMVYGEGLRDDYVAPEDLDATLESYGYESYREEHPHPRGTDAAADDAWDRAYLAWVRATAAPYLWGTTDSPFTGLTAAAVRERYVVSDPGEPLEVDPDFGIWELVEAAMEDFHEDAIDQVRDGDGLEAIFEAWKPHAGTGGPEDLALDAALADWSAKQTLVSYFVDETVVVPAFPDATREEAVAWIDACLAEARVAAAAARDGWEPVAEPEPEAAAPAFR